MIQMIRGDEDSIRVADGRVTVLGSTSTPTDCLTTLILHPNPARIRLWNKQWAASGEAFPPVARMPVALAMELAPLCRASRPLAGPATLHLLVASMLAETGIHPNPGLVRRLVGLAMRHRSMEALLQVSVPEEIAKNLPQGAREVLAGYATSLGGMGYWDSPSMLFALAAELGDRQSLAARHTVSRFRSVVVAGGRFLSPPEHKLIESLSGIIDIQVLEPESLVPRVTERLVVQQRSDYPRLAVGWARDGLVSTDGKLVDPETLMIVAPDVAVAADIARALNAAGLPASCPGHPVPLPGTRPAGILWMAACLRDGKISADDLEDLASHPLVAAGLPTPWLLPSLLGRCRGATARRTPADWHAFILEALTREEKGQDGSEPKGDPPKPGSDARNSNLTNHRTLAEALCDLLERAAGTRVGEGGVAGLAYRAGKFLDSLGIREALRGSRMPADLPPQELETDQLAWENLADVLSELARFEGMAGPAGALSRLDAWDILAVAISAESFSTAGRETGAIRVTRPEGVPGLRCQHLLWLGLEQGSYPRPINGDGLVTTKEAALAKELDLLYLAEGVRLGARTTMVRAAHDGPRQLPAGSFWEHEMIRSTGVAELPPDSEPVRRLLALGRTGATAAVAAIVRGIQTDQSVTEWLNRLPRMGSGGMPTTEAGEALTKMVAAAWPEERSLSATALEAHAACHFLFHAQRTLGCRDRKGASGQSRRGEWIHKGLELSSEEGGPYPPPASRLEHHLKGCLPHHAEAMDPHQATRIGELARRISALAGEESLLALKVHAVEWESLVEFQGSGELAGCRLKVRVDAILAGEGGLEVLLDCKTGSMERSKARLRLTRNRMQQPTLYALARMDWHHRNPGGRPSEDLGAVLLTVPDSGEPQLLWLTDHGPTGKDGPPIASLGPTALEEIRLAMLRQVGDIRGGKMDLAAFGPGNRDTPCTAWCHGRDACRHPMTYVKGFAQ